MTEQQTPSASLPHAADRARPLSTSSTLVGDEEHQATLTDFAAFAATLADLDTLALVLRTGSSARAHRRATTSAAHDTVDPTGVRAATSPTIPPPPPPPPTTAAALSWLLRCPQSADDLSLVLRRGEVARAGRTSRPLPPSSPYYRNRGRAAHNQPGDEGGEHVAVVPNSSCRYVAYSPPSGATPTSPRPPVAQTSPLSPGPRYPRRVSDELFLSTPPPPVGGAAAAAGGSGFLDVSIAASFVRGRNYDGGLSAAGASAPVVRGRRPSSSSSSSSSSLSIQETIFHVRRLSDAQPGHDQAGVVGGCPAEPFIGGRADLPSERARRLGRHVR